GGIRPGLCFPRGGACEVQQVVGGLRIPLADELGEHSQRARERCVVLRRVGILLDRSLGAACRVDMIGRGSALPSGGLARGFRLHDFRLHVWNLRIRSRFRSNSSTNRRTTSAAGGMSRINPLDCPASISPSSTSPSRIPRRECERPYTCSSSSRVAPAASASRTRSTHGFLIARTGAM